MKSYSAIALFGWPIDELAALLPVGKDAVSLILETSDQDDDAVDERPDPQKAKREQHQQTGAYLSHVKPVNSRNADEPENPAQQNGNQTTFAAGGTAHRVKSWLAVG